MSDESLFASISLFEKLFYKSDLSEKREEEQILAAFFSCNLISKLLDHKVLPSSILKKFFPHFQLKLQPECLMKAEANLLEFLKFKLLGPSGYEFCQMSQKVVENTELKNKLRPK